MRIVLPVLLVIATAIGGFWIRRPSEASAAVEQIPWGVQRNRTQEIGRRVYLRYCAGCHGKEGDGFGINATKLETPPTDFTSPQFPGLHPKSTILDWLEGRRPRPAPLCPDWSHTLSPAESDAVAEYLLMLAART